MKHFILLFLISLCFASCERCVTCKQLNASGTSVIEYPETCGSKSNILDYQDRLQSRKIPGNTVECTQKVIMPWQ